MQTVSGETTTVAASVDSAGPTFSITIGDDIDGSSASVSDNVIQAQAHANRASNSLWASGTEIVVVPNVPAEDALAGLTMDPFTGTGTFEADAAFTVQNVQSGADSVSAVLVDTGVLLDIGGNVGTSSLTVDDNAFVATAYNNRADNALSLQATTLAATCGVQNFQVTSSNTSASTGEPGTEATDAEDVTFEFSPGAVSGTGFSINTGLGILFAEAGSEADVVVDTTGMSSGAIEFLEGEGFVQTGANEYTLTLEGGSGGTVFNYAALGVSDVAATEFVNDQTVITQDITVPATPGSPATKAVIASIGGNSGDIIDSSVSVDGNLDLATAISNHAGNLLEIDAVNLEHASGVEDFAEATVDLLGVTAQADHAVANYQLLEEGGLTEAEASISLGIAIDPADLGTSDISGSSLTVDGNFQQALAVGNRANSTIDINAVNSGFEGSDGATSALVSFQHAEEDVAVTADSWMEAFGPAGMVDSSLSISGNTTIAAATINQATNVSSVSTTNMATVDAPGDASASADIFEATASADHVLTSFQLVEEGGEASSSAELFVYNTEPFGTAGNSDTGVQSSSVTMSGNTAQSRAAGNDATNTLNLSAEANMSATGALNNTQRNFGDLVEAMANGDVAFQMDVVGGVDAAIGDSSVTLDGNLALASSVANGAENEVNVAVGAGYGDMTGNDATASVDLANLAAATGSYALRSGQINESDSTADAELLVSAGMTGGDAATVSGSSVSLSDNVAQASARGNDSTSTMELEAGAQMAASGGLGSGQMNSGSVIDAQASIGVSLTASGDGDTIVDASSLAADGNAALASTTANRSVNTLSASSGAGFEQLIAGNGSASADGDADAEASYAMVNGQFNLLTGVSAGADMSVAIDLSGGDEETVEASSVSASGNLAQAQSRGNEASNTLELSAGASLGATGALASTQFNILAGVGASATGNVSIDASGPDADVVVNASSLAADDNLVLASAAANTATNTLSASSGAGFEGLASGDANATADDEASAIGNYTLANQQVNLLLVVDADADSTVGITLSGGGEETVSSSSVSAAGNVAQAQAQGNVGRNAMEIKAGADNSASGALSSSQANLALVTATATGNISIGVSGDGSDAIVDASSLAADGNLVAATARGNNVVNTLVASSGAGYSAVSGLNANADSVVGTISNGTYALASEQTVVGVVGATATSDVNIDVAGPATTTAGTVDSSSLHAVGNRTQAMAEGNAAVNVMDLSAGAVMSASGALANSQTSEAVVTASATSNIGLSADGAGDTVVGDSSLTVNDNTTVASARGNTALNALNATAGAGYASIDAAGASASSTNATATYAVLNAQTNNGPVLAGVTGSHTIALDGGTAATMSGSSATMNFNAYEARATGNFAENSIRISAVPGGNASAALASTQLNTGAVTATASSITMGVSVAGAGMAGSSVTMSGNSITASATGNSAVNRVGSSSF